MPLDDEQRRGDVEQATNELELATELGQVDLVLGAQKTLAALSQ